MSPDPSAQDRVLRRLSLPDPPRHRLPRLRALLQDAGRRLLPRRPVPGHRPSRHLADPGAMRDVCQRNARALGRGRWRSCTASSTRWSTTTAPRWTSSAERLDQLETEIFERPDARLRRDILDFKSDVSSLRRVVLPQRDAVGRLARREFPMITESLAYRFRDVHDHLIRLVDEAMFFQDRVTSLLDAHLSMVSNQLNGVMKALTIIATIFMTLDGADLNVGNERDPAGVAWRRSSHNSGGCSPSWSCSAPGCSPTSGTRRWL